MDRLPHYRDPLWRAVQHGREGGAVTSAIEALLLLSAAGWLTGTWDDVLAPWVARASSELRAAGQPAAHDPRPDPVTLTRSSERSRRSRQLA